MDPKNLRNTSSFQIYPHSHFNGFQANITCKNLTTGLQGWFNMYIPYIYIYIHLLLPINSHCTSFLLIRAPLLHFLETLAATKSTPITSLAWLHFSLQECRISEGLALRWNLCKSYLVRKVTQINQMQQIKSQVEEGTAAKRTLSRTKQVVENLKEHGKTGKTIQYWRNFDH